MVLQELNFYRKFLFFEEVNQALSFFQLSFVFIYFYSLQAL